MDDLISTGDASNKALSLVTLVELRKELDEPIEKCKDVQESTIADYVTAILKQDTIDKASLQEVLDTVAGDVDKPSTLSQCRLEALSVLLRPNTKAVADIQR
eukprot:13857488-Alexandrium_andersonii.AAC.1